MHDSPVVFCPLTPVLIGGAMYGFVPVQAAVSEASGGTRASRGTSTSKPHQLGEHIPLQERTAVKPEDKRKLPDSPIRPVNQTYHSVNHHSSRNDVTSDCSKRQDAAGEGTSCTSK